MLTGHYSGWDCNRRTGVCNATAAPPARTLHINVNGVARVLGNSTGVHVTVASIPNTGVAALTAPLLVQSGRMGLHGDGSLRLALTSSLNEVRSITISQ